MEDNEKNPQREKGERANSKQKQTWHNIKNKQTHERTNERKKARTGRRTKSYTEQVSKREMRKSYRMIL